MINWDDLKYLLATVQSGSFAKAGRELGVNRTTVARRVGILEQQLGTPLLEQASCGYQLTAAGDEVIASARQLERQVSRLEEKLVADNCVISGSLRVAVPLGLGPEFMPELAVLSSAFPGLDIELLNTVDPMASINQRQADVGIGVGHSLPDYLSGQQVGELRRAVYAARAYTRQRPASLPYSEHQWIGWGREMAHSQVAKWIRQQVSTEADVRLRVNSWHALREAVIKGVGVGHLWCFLADREKSLVQISPVIPELTTGLWVFHHREVQNNRRVKVFIDTVAPLLADRIMLPVAV